MAVHGRDGEEVTTGRDDDGVLVEIRVAVGFEHDQVDLAILDVVCRAYLAVL